MPQFPYVSYPDGCTSDEFHKLLELRLATLDDATRLHGLGSPLPVRWRKGWAATLSILGRDREGSLCASVTVTAPVLAMPYVRRVRLCNPKPLPWSVARD